MIREANVKQAIAKMDPGLSLDNLEAHVADVENFLKEEKERFSTGKDPQFSHAISD